MIMNDIGHIAINTSLDLSLNQDYHKLQIATVTVAITVQITGQSQCHSYVHACANLKVGGITIFNVHAFHSEFTTPTLIRAILITTGTPRQA